MQSKLKKLKKEFIDKLDLQETLDDLENLRTEYLGRKGKLTKVFKELKDVAEEEKPALGKLVNDIKQEAEKIFKQVKNNLQEESGETNSSAKEFDATQPGLKQETGSLHPLTQIKNDLNDAFKSLGFEIYQGPEISSEKYVFDNLNFPPNHSARESMDTYWVVGSGKREAGKQKDKLCLRPHLTGASVRFMQTHQPPFRVVYPGRVFRAENTDAGHERCFYQWEALIVDKNLSFSSGKILIDTILERVFGKPVKTRMRVGFFPFVEPGFEIDMQCLNCGGKGCSICSDGWVEMMPGGVPHPNVLQAGGIDSDQWQGFYINIGLDRLAMMKYGIDDIRLFHSGDLRFLRQF